MAAVASVPFLGVMRPMSFRRGSYKLFICGLFVHSLFRYVRERIGMKEVGDGKGNWERTYPSTVRAKTALLPLINARINKVAALIVFSGLLRRRISVGLGEEWECSW